VGGMFQKRPAKNYDPPNGSGHIIKYLPVDLCEWVIIRKFIPKQCAARIFRCLLLPSPLPFRPFLQNPLPQKAGTQTQKHPTFDDLVKNKFSPSLLAGDEGEGDRYL
jgi:hypothetical protein